jgi:lipid-A-disaccharide synthase
MVAGETSGDILAGSVLAAIQRLRPEAQTFGVGGPRMLESDFQAWHASEELAVRGYVEVLSAYPRLLNLRRKLVHRIAQAEPNLFVGVDAPDFNLGLERQLLAKGVKTAHFVSPSVWAWRAGRIDGIRSAVSHMLVLFPFEQEIYRKARIPATFVGHPLADVIALESPMNQARQRLGIAENRPVFTIMPGSRLSEITYNGACFLETAKALHSLRDGSLFLLPAATPTIKVRLERLIEGVLGRAEQRQIDIRLLDGQSHDAMQAANGVLVASGTATLEVALFHKPMVIAYRVNALSYAIMKPMAYLPYIGLPNILCGEFIVPEYVQGAAQPTVMAESLLRQVDDDAHVDRLRQRFGQLHQELRQGCGLKSAEVLLELAGDRAMLTRAR